MKQPRMIYIMQLTQRIYDRKQCRTGFDFIDLDLTKLV